MSNDTDDVSERSKAHKDARESSIEDVLASVRDDLGSRSYPTTSEELAATYADGSTDLPNETESIGSAFDRLDEQFDDADEAYRALVAEFEDGAYRTARPDAERGGASWSEERVDDDRSPADDDTDGQRKRSRERARRSQAADAESDDDEE